MEQKSSIKIEHNVLTVCGVSTVDSVFDKEATLTFADGKLVVKGNGISVAKLNVEEGIATIKFSDLNSLIFGGGEKFSFKNLFK